MAKNNANLTDNEYFKVKIEITENNKQKAEYQKYPKSILFVINSL